MAKRQASLFDFCPRALKKQRECQSEEKTDESDDSTFQEEDRELLEVSFARSWTFLKLKNKVHSWSQWGSQA